jgi:alpha/beta superfamily hydrolase
VRIRYTGIELDGVVQSCSTDRGVLLLHPHPLYGGNMDNDIVVQLESLLGSMGITTAKINFRGADGSINLYQGPPGAVVDAVGAYEYMRDELALSSIGVLGYSFGGSIVLASASRLQPAFLVALSASREIFLDAGSSLADLSSVTCPVLLCHGLSDTVVPVSDLDCISSSFRQRVEILRLKGEGHFYLHSLGSVRERVRAFVRRSWS